MLAYCTEANAADCSNIFVGGARDTLIKLPDGCGRSPFAHVVSFVPKSKLSSSLKKKIGKGKVSVYELTVCAHSFSTFILRNITKTIFN